MNSFWLVVACLLLVEQDFGVSALQCYTCGLTGDVCPVDASTSKKEDCTNVGEKCKSETIYKNGTLINTIRTCIASVNCNVPACTPETGANKESTCTNCCDTNLCNTIVPAPKTPSSATSLGNPVLTIMTVGLMLLSMLMLKN